MQFPVIDRPTSGSSPGIVIRRVRPSDREDLSRFYGALSAESRRARFLGYTRGLSGAAARSFCTLDHVHDEGFVAVESDEGRDRIVGHLCLVASAAEAPELAVAVADEHQGRGIGRRLFEAAL